MGKFVWKYEMKCSRAADEFQGMLNPNLLILGFN